jgi:hypothetical protein
MTTLSRAARSTSEPALRSDRLLRGWGGCRFSAQRRTQRRPRPRSPQTVGRWSSERPKTANITRRRPTGKVLLLRTGFHAIDRYRHRRPVLVLPRRRPQVDTQHLPPILRVSKPLAVERGAYTFAALATTKAARPANSHDVPSSCAHHLRNSGEVPAHLLRAFLRTGNWYELADRSSVVVRRSTMEVTRAGRRRPFDDKSTRPFPLVTTIE